LNRPGHVSDQVPSARRKALEKHAQVLVSQTFFGTLLKQLRESPFRSELFDGGRGGQAFGSLFDQHLAERMSRGAGQKLVRAIVRKLEAGGGKAS
jgi:Rod binding domain-containing protein